MREFFSEKLFILNQEFKTKDEALSFLSTQIVEKKFGTNKKAILDAAQKREKEFSTAIGNKIAMPHIRIAQMKKSVVVYARVKPLDWNSMDNEKIEHIFFIALNEKDNVHMEIISTLSQNVMDPLFVNKLDTIKTYNEFVDLFKNKENTNKDKKITKPQEKTNYDIVAITACPTGIAHTYMAKDALIAKAEQMGISIKVETQGTEGSRNTLSQEEIDNAKGVILAIDRAVELNRFTKHQNVLETSTRKAMKKPEEEIQFVLDKKGEKLKSAGAANASSEAISFNFDNFGKRLYKALMTGVSYMLPFVIFGGIMIAIAFMIDTFAGNKDAGGDFGTINPSAKWFKTIGGLSFDLMVPILSAYIAYALVGKIGLLPAFVTGMISSGKMGNFSATSGWLGTPANVSSGFFGAIAGAIFVGVLIILFMKYLNPKVPKSLNGIMQILIVPFVGTLIIAGLFFLVNIPFLYLNDGFNWLLNKIGNTYGASVGLGLLLGLMMATDMGGPINKSAYIFATATLESSSNDGTGTVAMASVMAAGMVPPLGIAISTAIFRKKLWTQEEVDTTASNTIMGLSFITEGAIPFAAKDPKTIIPASMAGAGISGMLVALLQIKSAAPHGGIFVLPLIRSELFGSEGLKIGLGITFYLVSILAGAIITALMIWVLKAFVWKNKSNKPDLDNKKPFLKLKKRNKESAIKIENNLTKANYYRKNLWFTQ